MGDMNPLFDKRTIKAGEASIRLTLMPTRDAYLVEVVFPLDAFRVYTSKWANPMRVALEAAEEALNELKAEIFNQELKPAKVEEKMFPVEPSEEKDDGH